MYIANWGLSGQGRQSAWTVGTSWGQNVQWAVLLADVNCFMMFIYGRVFFYGSDAHVRTDSKDDINDVIHTALQNGVVVAIQRS